MAARLRIVGAVAAVLVLAGCGALTRALPTSGPASAPAAEPSPGEPRRGAYYKDDGPGANAPPNLEQTPDAVPRAEPLHRFANRPYEVFGKQYVPLAQSGGFRERGIGSWYGRRYHGQRTSSGEPYDMYAMSAAHPTLPIPSYVRVTSIANGRSVVVRVNDRGPFHAGRVIDLSYTAALKLGYVDAGSAQVEIESLAPGNAPLAAPPQPATLPVAPVASAEGHGGIFLQLGAFSTRDNAESFRARVQRELAWLNDAMRVSAGGGLYRLHLGPYASTEDARRIAERIRTELGVAPILVSR
ncbi:MAG: septal ring lytic transglycosylase RlpA family protein [Betaproteobacteria bacterium]|nr:septal ring lytic transglycosylase RlpA family protein [Betaproteobacteria bacterium]